MQSKDKRVIPFSPPDISEIEIEEVIDSLKSGWITTGPKVKKLEQKITEFCGTSKTACLNSNTACAEMTLRILGVGPGDEVILPAYTYTATASVVSHVGAKIILVDCDKDSYTMDLKHLESLINERTKVIIPVDLFGIPSNTIEIKKIVESKKDLFRASENEVQQKINRIIIMTDGAHSFGSKIYNTPSAKFSDFTNYSFHAVKNLTTAEGGAVTWNDIEGVDSEELYREYMIHSLHGQTKDALEKTKMGSWEYDIIDPLYKCNLTDIHAAIGLGQLKRYENLLSKRKELIERYYINLKNLNVKYVNHYSEKYQSSSHLFVIRLYHNDYTPFSEEERNLVIKKLSEVGISSNVHYKPLPLLTAYSKLGFSINDYPNSYELYKNSVSLPLHTKLDISDIDYISKCLKDILDNK